mmetsp:Transcript_433/g.512  ORF Transcript_433/g.512 Transcript_433/m.512 type:complete len:604 (-) Transcript_433:1957-3768(-)
MLFKKFDTNKQDCINFEEFMEGLAAYTKCTKKQLQRLLFILYDLTGDGSVNEDELATMMFSTFHETIGELDSTAKDTHAQVESFVHKVIKKFGKTVKHQMNFEEFCQFLNEYPKIQETFDKCFQKNLWSASNYPEPSHEIQRSGKKVGCFSSSKPKRNQVNEPITPLRAQGTEMSGFVQKTGADMSNPETRYAILRSNLMMFYEDPDDPMPDAVIFMEGCYIEKLTEKLGLSIVHHFHEFSELCIVVDSIKSLNDWFVALERACNNRHFEDFFMMSEEQVGSGKFSKVYLGYDLKNEERWAVKVIDKRKLNEVELELLRCEIAIMRLIHHPNVVMMKDIFDTKTTLYIVMELVEGGELFEKLVEEKHFSEYVACCIAKQLLDTVAYLHRAGIVHRDIKPENIMLVSREDNPVIKLVDFGMSKLIGPNEKAKVPCGTLDYAAPELLSGHGYNREVDMWSTGVVTYLMLTGTLPFGTGENNVVIRKILEANIDFDDEIWTAFTPECKDFLSHLLTKNLSERMSAEEALRHPWIVNRDRLNSKEVRRMFQKRGSESIIQTRIRMSSHLLRADESRSVVASVPDLLALGLPSEGGDLKLEVRLRQKA